jgi:anti-sigma regulatory factor (Ser/Thr protein kinase)
VPLGVNFNTSETEEGSGLEKQKAGGSGYTVNVPSDLEYVPPLRQFIAEIARVEGFSKKFCFRTEIIVDELATNGILHGSQEVHTSITLAARFDSENMHLSVQDQGGSLQNLENLKRCIYSPKPASQDKKKGRGLVIVQMLANELKINLEENGHTQVSVTKVKEGDELNTQREKLLYESDL